MRIVFAGTPDFAVPPLQALIKSEHPVVGVFTQPDRPSGRGRKLTPSPVKQLALEAGIEVFQPDSLKTEEQRAPLEALRPDLLVVVAYGLILPQAVIDLPPLGCINIHASLLPRWRGASPLQHAVLRGDSESGVTLMFIEPRLDAGPMLLKKKTPISADDTAGDLHDRLARLGAEALIELLPRLAAGTCMAEQQDDAHATYAGKISKEDAVLDWCLPALELARRVMAYNPWPVAETLYNGQTLRIWRARAIDIPADAPPGTLLASKSGLEVATGKGRLDILELQLPGGKRITARDFLNAKPMLDCMLGASD